MCIRDSHHAGIHVIIEKQQSIELYFVSSCWYSRNRNSSESSLCCCSRFYTCTWCVLYEYQIRGILVSPTWYIRLHWYQVPGCIRVRSMHAGIHVIEKQQSIRLYHHAGIHATERRSERAASKETTKHRWHVLPDK